MAYLMQLRTIKPKTGCHSYVFVWFAKLETKSKLFLTLKGAQSPAQTIEENGCLKKRSLTDGWQKEQGGQAWRRESSKAQSHQRSRMKLNEEGKKSSAATIRKRGSRTRGGGGEAGI
ncbi:hypothetical protein TRIATDRAFT_301316 [Trichoderma atroviride IMI 206040]|uniref:Uncharacterized protein n=1 Tax=Hypocrea atroviridis (strain ATCC 20476 / IMI 206040) TaxID=452589 RepID=G9P2L7_HYPAI|nr:uncharacterized protein TRIATDRAFT_301316 [Trichoderma atroviride IMI 206040]EHK43535.1 hypothetical protein TRIATDRAFT_301316 [Trichoderma atroviride IMI 206040]